MKIEKNRVLLLVGLAFLTINWAMAQIYRSPVDFPISLSGNVGELRSDHFHTGLDIRGGGVVGAPIYSVADGCVSRIFVSPYGYGNALYITNSNGTMAVYAHLDRFVDKIAKWVERQQYARKSFAVDLYPSKEVFPVKKGDRIASLGNSGSSGGPHLHFEIRDARTMNPMNIGHQKLFSVPDNIAPTVRRIYLYEQDTVLGVTLFRKSSSIEITKNKAGQWELSDSVLYFDRPSYLAYEMVDFKNGSSFTMGVYSLVQRVDGVRNFGYKIDDISFATTRYVNALAQYDLNKATRNAVVRAYIAPNNLLNNYVNKKDNGVILPPTRVGERLAVSTVLLDDNENSSTVEFYLERRKSKRVSILPDNNVRSVLWDRDFIYKDSVMSVYIPAKTLYEATILPFSFDGKHYCVGDQSVPLLSYITLKVNDVIPINMQSKALFLTASGRNAGGSFVDGKMTLRTRSFGVYSIGYDTIAPVIYRLKTENKNQLRFKITDNLSGVATYQLMINGEWALAQYDPKNNSLIHRFVRAADVEKDRAIELKVVDGKGNAKIYKTKERW